jgi:hypothetical protein
MKLDEIKKLELGDIHPNDILLFSPVEKDATSQLIALLTNIPLRPKVSHAALCYVNTTGHETIIEETPPQVQINPAKKRFENRTIYVLRPIVAPIDSPIKFAKEYFDKKIPFAESELYMIGLLLIYKKFSPTSEAQRYIIQFFKMLIEKLKKHPNQHPMFCSQFVAQCYEDARIKLEFEKKVIESSADIKQESSILEQTIESSSDIQQESSILEQVIEHRNSQMENELIVQEVYDDKQENLTTEQLCEKLLIAINGQAGAEDAHQNLIEDLAQAVIGFSNVHYFLNHPELELTGSDNDQKFNREALSYLSDNLSDNLYTFPVDFFECTNFNLMGQINGG